MAISLRVSHCLHSEILILNRRATVFIALLKVRPLQARAGLKPRRYVPDGPM